MELGVGLDQSLALAWPDLARAAREAERLGYTSAWTPSGLDRDAIALCLGWHAVAPSLLVGTNVVPSPLWTVPTLGALAATAAGIIGDRFVLGIGAGRSDLASPVATMREHLTALRERLAKGRVPVYLGALGPRMLRLAGELADGAALNWCTPEQIAWSRRRVAEGAARRGRDPQAVRVVEYVRVAVGDDADAARRAIARASLRYFMNPSYAKHFTRMGLGDVVSELAARRARGAAEAELVDAIPADAVGKVGYFGPSKGAAAGFRALAAGLDVAIVRVVPVRPGIEPVLATIRACAA